MQHVGRASSSSHGAILEIVDGMNGYILAVCSFTLTPYVRIYHGARWQTDASNLSDPVLFVCAQQTEVHRWYLAES